jgi:hypothetical protein
MLNLYVARKYEIEWDSVHSPMDFEDFNDMLNILQKNSEFKFQNPDDDPLSIEINADTIQSAIDFLKASEMTCHEIYTKYRNTMISILEKIESVYDRNNDYIVLSWF